MASLDVKTFEERMAKFKLKYSEIYPNCIGYIKIYWLELYKEIIIKAWVNIHLYFSNIATLRQVDYSIYN